MLKSLALRATLLLALCLPGAAFAQVVGSPWPVHTISAGNGADGARLYDANGDGYLDISTGFEESNASRIMFNPGPSLNGSPWPHSVVGSTPDAEDAVMTDIDGDGVTDLIAATEGSDKSVAMFFGPAPQLFCVAAPVYLKVKLNTAVGFVSTQYMFSVPADINGDGRMDIIVGGKNSSQVGYFTSTSGSMRTATNWRYYKLRNAGWIMSLILRDMDSDGDQDLLLSDRNSFSGSPDTRGIYWLRNPGAASLLANPSQAWASQTVGMVGQNAMLLAVGDLDGDGFTDIASGNGSNQSINIFYGGDTAGTIWAAVQPVVTLGSAFGSTGKAMSFADIDNDGDQDVVFSAANADGNRSGLIWLEYTDPRSTSGWTAHQVAGPLGIKYDLVPTIDMDADGDLDIVTTEENEVPNSIGLGVLWYENPLL